MNPAKPVFSLSYVQSLMGPLGLYQHARYTIPRLEEGYCTDDNARLVQLLVELLAAPLASLNPSTVQQARSLLDRSWKFVCEAQTSSGVFRNFRSNDGRWLDEAGSEDTQARVARALAVIIAKDPDTRRRQSALQRLRRLLSGTVLGYPRGPAELLIAFGTLPVWVRSAPDIQAVFHRTASAYVAAWQNIRGSKWPWIEPRLTYANALLPHALVVTVQTLSPVPGIRTALSRSTQFLLQTTIDRDMFFPVGNYQWYPREGQKSRYDQQPIEAHTMLDFLLAYSSLRPRPLPASTIAAAYLWFFGHNSQGAIMANPVDGSCCDGLTEQGANLNCGAESILAYLRSELLMRQAPPAVRAYAEIRARSAAPMRANAASPT